MTSSEHKECCQQCAYRVEGECRRYPPTIMWNDTDEGVVWANAPVEDDHWCGEFKQKFDQ